jgi:hypothetical protein
MPHVLWKAMIAVDGLMNGLRRQTACLWVRGMWTLRQIVVFRQALRSGSGEDRH